MFAKILKANPYHDETGRFSTQDKAKFVSTSGVFASRLSKARGSSQRTPQKDYDAWKDGLTAEESTALDVYWQGTDNHRAFNEWVRSDYSGKTTTAQGKKYQKVQDQIDSALSKAKLPEDKVLYRASALPGVTAKNAAELVGGTIKDRGYTATTSDPEYAKKFATIKSKGTFMFNITVKKGTEGVANLGNRRPRLGESEFLFSRGTSMRVKSYDRKTKTFNVEVE